MCFGIAAHAQSTDQRSASSNAQLERATDRGTGNLSGSYMQIAVSRDSNLAHRPDSDNLSSTEGQVRVPQLKFWRSIALQDEGRNSWVKALTFSPDGQYLAIVDNPAPIKTDVLIWDLQRNTVQARISGLPDFGDSPQTLLLWSPEGKYLTFGRSWGRDSHIIQFWDPMSGQLVREAPISTNWSQFNGDGTKLLTTAGTGEHPAFRI